MIVYPDDFAPNANQKVFYTESSSIWIYKNIIYIFSHPNIVHTLEHAQASNAILDKIIPSLSYPMMCDVRHAKPLPKSVRNYYASADGTRHCTKFAFLVASSFSRVVANFFIGFSSVEYPIKMFDNITTATDWCLNK